jgi:hypothetical protein
MSPPTSPAFEPVPRMNRREVLSRAAVLAAAAGLSLTDCLRPTRAFAGGGGRALTDAEWTTMAAVQETLWPAGPGVPGARDVNATAVLDAALGDPGTPPIEREWVRGGIPALHELAHARGASTFESLDPAGREAVLVAYRERDEGSGWIKVVLGYTLEAVLGDPVHGGNPGEIGWRWAGYEPAELRPASASRGAHR